jgi:hypothetical protein
LQFGHYNERIVSCVLRVGGRIFDVAAFLAESPFRPCAVFTGNEIRHGRPRDPGFNLEVSRADFSDGARQVEDAIKFLTQHSAELQRLRTFAGVEGIELDFAIEDREVSVQTDRFPSQLLQLMGSRGIDIAISRYPRADDSEAQD